MDETELEQRIRELWEIGTHGKKEIARRLGLPPKRVRAVLTRLGLAVKPPPPTDKLAPFRARIQQLVSQGLQTSRILEDLKAEGYGGGRTILGDYVRTLNGPARNPTKRFRRFETDPGVEAQADWTTHRVVIAGVERPVHFFSILLAWSRYWFIGAYRNERLPTLLAAHAEAFASFGGVTSRIVYDNMSTVTLGRRGRETIWHPRLLEFAKHWGYDPFTCRVKDPNRKGKVERPFPYHYNAFLKQRRFDSWDHLESEQRVWIEKANQRKHGTTHQVPAKRLEQERPLLTEPPETPFPAYQEETRAVYHDCTISVGGVSYSVPAHLAGRTVAVRVHLRHFEVLDDQGAVQARHAIHELGDGLVIDPAHYDSIRRGPGRSATDLQTRFLSRFPGAEAFLDGLKRRMKTLAHVHTVQVERLAVVYGTAETADAIAHATGFGNFNAKAIDRILRDRFPLKAVEPPGFLCTASASANRGLTDDTDTGSLEDYDLEGLTHTTEEDDDDAAGCAARR